MKQVILLSLAAVSTLFLSSCAHEPVTQANVSQANASEISSESQAALKSLYASNPDARRLGRKAAGVLVFPKILKGGFVLGAEGGNGALIRNGKVTGYYQTAAASYGLQLGVEKFGYALFLMDNKAIADLNNAAGWDVGSSPSVVVVDRGAAAELTARSGHTGSYAVFFNQKGLMAGVSLKGSKITRINPAN